MIGKKYEFIQVERPIDNAENGIVYVSYSDCRIDFICPCGCGDLVILSMLEDTSPCWKVIDKNTIRPSINRIVGCRSHFEITNGIVH